MSEAKFQEAKAAQLARVVAALPKFRAAHAVIARDYQDPYGHVPEQQLWTTWLHRLSCYLDGPGEEVDLIVMRDLAKLPPNASPEIIETTVLRFRMGGLRVLEENLLGGAKRIREGTRLVEGVA